VASRISSRPGNNRSGLALGTTLVAPLARWLIVTHDWRFAMLTLGFIAWAAILPTALLLRPAPAIDGGSATVRSATDAIGPT
jgi:predicted MFS family arabinose efflux permease